MNPRLLFRILFLLCVAAASAGIAEAKKVPLRVTSEPAGATVEFNGSVRGVTPLELEIEDWMVKGKGKFLWSKYLNEPITMTVRKDGYSSKSIEMTRGPYRWVNGNGTAVHVFYVVTNTTWHVKLDQKVEFTSTNPFAAPSVSSASSTAPVVSETALAPTPVAATLSTEQVVSHAIPSVVTIRTEDGTGTGFFITENGVIVTNRHVVGSHSSVKVITSTGTTVESVSVFVSPDRDLALIKIDSSGNTWLRLANPTTINVGAEVVAIGSPALPGSSGVLSGTVTRGIVSAFRTTKNHGVLVQTDVAINPGNSGGPLLNLRGEVVGVNTMKVSMEGIEGLNFAIMSSEVFGLLKTHFDYVPEPTDSRPASEYAATPAGKSADGTVTVSSAVAGATPQSSGSAVPTAAGRVVAQISSEPSGADIYVDEQFLGSTPSKVPIATGEHVIRVSRPGYAEWRRQIRIEPGSDLTLNAVLERLP